MFQIYYLEHVPYCPAAHYSKFLSDSDVEEIHHNILTLNYCSPIDDIPSMGLPALLLLFGEFRSGFSTAGDEIGLHSS